MGQRQTVELPEKLQPLFKPKRYKVLYGGRGGAKSWGIAQALLILGAQKPLRILCTREIQKSIQDSVHRLLADRINAMALEGFYEVQQSKIIGQNGTEFLFAGLRHNINSLKSYEGVDIVWVEEAQTVSEQSWNVLIPTIRKESSEIWISFNPDLEDDPTYQRFIIHPPEESVVIKVNYDGNPWFPDVLDMERRELKNRAPVAYEHVWLGKCKQAIEGAIFAREINQAQEEQRITRVPVQSGIPVQTFWDLGHSDNTAIWFCQLVGMEYRLIDYYQASAHKMPHYIEVLAKRGYMYGNHHLPHDADYDQLAASSTIRQQMQDAIRDNSALGKTVIVVPRIPKKALAIDAARNIFERCVFDSVKTADGLHCLRRYRYAINQDTGKISKEPQHDQWSHGADAFMQLAQHAKPAGKKKSPPRINTKWIK